MAIFRKFVFWTHLILGAAAGVVVLIMSVTGVLLTYEKQMIAWSDREYRRTPPGSDAEPLPAGKLVAAVMSAGEKQPESLTWESDREAPVALGYGREVLYANPYTGEILGAPATGMRKFMSDMRAWHRWLAATGESRATARAITGASNAAFLFLVVSGMYLWIPNKWTRNRVKAIALFRSGLTGKARDFNWHHVAGIWAAVPLFVVVLSGMVISYPWFSQFIMKLADGDAAVAASPAAPGGSRGAGAGTSIPAVSERGGSQNGAARGGQAEAAGPDALDAMYASLREGSAGWKTIVLQVPKAGARQTGASVAYGTGGQPQYRETLSLNAGSGSLEKREDFASLSPGRRIRSWMRFAHTGEYYGVIGQSVAGLASAAGILLVYSGFALAVRRFLAWRRRRAVKVVELEQAA